MMISSKKYILILTLFLLACSSKAEQEAKARHQAETGARLNESQKNTESLFKEMDN